MGGLQDGLQSRKPDSVLTFNENVNFPRGGLCGAYLHGPPCYFGLGPLVTRLGCLDLALEEGRCCPLGSRRRAGPGTNSPPRPTWLPRGWQTRGQAGLCAPTFP